MFKIFAKYLFIIFLISNKIFKNTLNNQKAIPIALELLIISLSEKKIYTYISNDSYKFIIPLIYIYE